MQMVNKLAREAKEREPEKKLVVDEMTKVFRKQTLDEILDMIGYDDMTEPEGIIIDETIDTIVVEDYDSSVFYQIVCPEKIIAEVEVREEEREGQVDTREEPKGEAEKQMLSVLSLINIESGTYKCKPCFFPFDRQHSAIVHLGQLFQDKCLVDFHFPNVGAEYLTYKYKNNLGVYVPGSGIESNNNFSHVVMSARPYAKGTEFIIFGVLVSGQMRYYLWTNLDIEEIYSTCCVFGIKYNNTFTVYYAEDHNLIPKNMVYADHCVFNEGLIHHCLDKKFSLLLLIDGVEYLACYDRMVVLKYDGKENMVDAQGVVYLVDYIVRMGTYVYDGAAWRYVSDVHRYNADSTIMVNVIQKKLFLIEDFFKYIRVPSGMFKVFQVDSVFVGLVGDHRNMHRFANMRDVVPFYCKTNLGRSKNSIIQRDAAKDKIVFFDSYMTTKTEKGFFIGNNNFDTHLKKPIALVFFKRHKHGDKYLKVLVVLCGNTAISVPNVMYYTVQASCQRREFVRVVREKNTYVYVGDEVKTGIAEHCARRLERKVLEEGKDKEKMIVSL
jgi:hypothetical protein